MKTKLKVKVKKKVKSSGERKPRFEWRNNIRYCIPPSGNEWQYAKRSPKFPNESELAQILRLRQNVPDKVNIEQDVLHTKTERNTSPTHRVIGTILGALKIGAFFASGNMQGEVLNQYGSATYVRLISGYQDCTTNPYVNLSPGAVVSKISNPNEEEDFWNTIETTLSADARPAKSSGVNSKKSSDRQPASKEVDEWGYRIGTGAAKINSVLTSKWKTAGQIEKESQCGRTSSSHLSALKTKGLIVRGKLKDGTKVFKLKGKK